MKMGGESWWTHRLRVGTGSPAGSGLWSQFAINERATRASSRRTSLAPLAEEARSVHTERAADRNEASREDRDHQDDDGARVGWEISRR